MRHVRVTTQYTKSNTMKLDNDPPPGSVQSCSGARFDHEWGRKQSRRRSRILFRHSPSVRIMDYELDAKELCDSLDVRLAFEKGGHLMFRLLIFRLSRRRAVSTIIGGMIILSLILTALGTMVFVSQQYDQYQQTAYKMAQYQDQGQSENLVANSSRSNEPNLRWIGCGGCNMYNMSLSNLGGVGVQIARIYITSQGQAAQTFAYSIHRAHPLLRVQAINTVPQHRRNKSCSTPIFAEHDCSLPISYSFLRTR